MLVLSQSELELYYVFFFWILDSMRKYLKIFENFSQPAEPIGKPDQPVH